MRRHRPAFRVPRKAGVRTVRRDGRRQAVAPSRALPARRALRALRALRARRARRLGLRPLVELAATPAMERPA
jgi:hypothetical protein